MTMTTRYYFRANYPGWFDLMEPEHAIIGFIAGTDPKVIPAAGVFLCQPPRPADAHILVVRLDPSWGYEVDGALKITHIVTMKEPVVEKHLAEYQDILSQCRCCGWNPTYSVPPVFGSVPYETYGLESSLNVTQKKLVRLRFSTRRRKKVKQS